MSQPAATFHQPTSPISPTPSPPSRLKRTGSAGFACVELPTLRPTSPQSPPREPGARRASFGDYEDACAKLGLLPKFARAVQERRCKDTLELSGLGFGDAQLQAMLGDRQLLPLANVTRFRVRDARLTGEGVEALVSKLPAQTEIVDLTHNETALRGSVAFSQRMQRRLLPQLRWLDLSMNNLRDAAIQPLAFGLLCCPLLIRLELNHNFLEEGQALGDLVASHPRLMRLSLHGNALNSLGGAQLFEGLATNARQDGQLSDLDVAWNHLDASPSVSAPSAAAALALAEVLRISVTLYHLDLSYNNLGPTSCEIIAEGLRDNHFLYGLHMVGNAATMDADGFLCPALESPKASRSFSTPSELVPPTEQHLARQGMDGRLGAKAVDYIGHGDHRRSTATDEEVLRERDVLEQQTTCWACEGWERLELRWAVLDGEPEPKAVWAFTSIDGFVSALRLKRAEHAEGATKGAHFAAARMVPRECKVLGIFQVDSALRVAPGATEVLEAPVEIELRACEELPILEPLEKDIASKEVVKKGGNYEHRLILRMQEANVLSRPATRGPLPSSRSVLLDGPGGPVQMPRITEREFRMKTKVPRGVPFYADWQSDDEKLEECFLLDWSRAKVARIVGKCSEIDQKHTEELVLSNYRSLVALYRELGDGFGVTQLEASALLMQAGLVDENTRVADIDRCFIAAKVLPSQLRKAGAALLGEKVLSRHQFLEFLLRVADQRFLQRGRSAGMADAMSQMMAALAPVAEAKMAELDRFHEAFHSDEVDDVIKKHHSTLQELYRRYSGRTTVPGAARFMSLGEFQDFLEASKSYNSDFVPRRCGVAFRLGMMTQPEEVFRSRFQEMNFLEFQHAVGMVTLLRSGSATSTTQHDASTLPQPARVAELVESFILQKLAPLTNHRRASGAEWTTQRT